MLEFAHKHNGPVAVRYPRSEAIGAGMKSSPDIEMGKGEVVFGASHHKTCIIAIGSMVGPSIEAAEKLGQTKVINARFVKPLDKDLIVKEAGKAEQVVTVEEGVLEGGFGSAVMELFSEAGVSVPVQRIGLPSKFIEHGKRDEILDEYGLTAEKIFKQINEHFSFPSPSLSAEVRRTKEDGRGGKVSVSG